MMLCVKNSRSLSATELVKINRHIDEDLGLEVVADLELNSSNMVETLDIIELDVHNVLSNDYVIYEGYDNKISGFLGIIINADEHCVIINQLYIYDMYYNESSFVIAEKLIAMVKMINKNPQYVILQKHNVDLIEFYHKLQFDKVDCCHINLDYDPDSQIIMKK